MSICRRFRNVVACCPQQRASWPAEMQTDATLRSAFAHMDIIPDKREVVGLIGRAHEGKICLPNFGATPCGRARK